MAGTDRTSLLFGIEMKENISILFYSILFYPISILLYSILIYSVLFYSILFYSILFYSILFYSILFYSILFYSILFYSILFYSILFYSILFHSILFYYSNLFYSILYQHLIKADRRAGRRDCSQPWTTASTATWTHSSISCSSTLTSLSFRTRQASQKSQEKKLVSFPYRGTALQGKSHLCIPFLWELRGLSPNFHIHVSVSHLYIPRIGPHISWHKSLTNILV